MLRLSPRPVDHDTALCCAPTKKGGPRSAQFSDYTSASAEVENVIERFDGLDIELAVAGDFKFVARAIGVPLAGAGQAHLAHAGDDFHGLRRAGAEGQRRRENHADGFLAAVGEQHAVRHALAVEVDIGFLDDADLIKLFVHAALSCVGSEGSLGRSASLKTQLRPPCLAAYKARSAWCTSCSTSDAGDGTMLATPIDMVTVPNDGA